MRGEEIALIAGMTLVTFAVRYPALALLGRTQLPIPLARALRFVPVAVLCAIIAPELLIRDGSLSVSPANSYLVGGAVSLFVAWRWGNLLLTIVVGMGSFLLWRAVV